MAPTKEMNSNAPLNGLEEWEDFLKERYPENGAKPFCATDPEKKKEQFRNYEADARPTVAAIPAIRTLAHASPDR